VGYCGGQFPDPTYERIGDHTEAIRVTFNPQLVALADMYRIFWREHTPSNFGCQYRSAIWCHSQTQRDVALAVRESLIGKSPYRSKYDDTAIEEAGPFYRAEGYHQRYLEKMTRGSLWSPGI
jgi:peptide-methionine (S)-S-oxide reductase